MLKIWQVDFDDIREPWLDWEKAGELPTVFQTLGWVETWWQCLGQRRNHENLLLAAYDNDVLLGIFPFYIEWLSLKGRHLWRVLRFMGYAESDYHDFIIRPGYENIVLTGLLKELKTLRWDIALWADLYHSSSYGPTIGDFLKRQGYYVIIKDHTICPYINLPVNCQQYLSSINKKTIKNIKYYQRKLGRLGVVEIKSASDDMDLSEGLKYFFQLHRSRWQMKGQKGALSREGLEDFHLRAAQRLAKYCQINFLYLNGKPISVDYAYLFRGRYCSYLRGFQPEFAAYRVGNILILELIKKAIDMRLTIFDFMRGGEEYKFLFAKKYLRNRKIIFAKRSFVLYFWRLFNLLG